MNEAYTDSIEYTHFLRFRESDQQSLAWLYRHLHPMLLRRGLHILPDEFAVSTAIQDAFLKAWTLRQRIESPKHLYCFLRLVTRWGCLDWYKRPENKLIYANNPPLSESIKDDTDFLPFEEPQEHHQQQEMLDTIYKVLHYLSPNRQTILTLHFKYGLSHGQIARRYASSNTAIHHELQKGLDQLKRIIHIQKRFGETAFCSRFDRLSMTER